MVAIRGRCPYHLRHGIAYQLEALVVLFPNLIYRLCHLCDISTSDDSSKKFSRFLVPDSFAETIKHHLLPRVRMEKSNFTARKWCLGFDKYRNWILRGPQLSGKRLVPHVPPGYQIKAIFDRIKVCSRMEKSSCGSVRNCQALILPHCKDGHFSCIKQSIFHHDDLLKL